MPTAASIRLSSFANTGFLCCLHLGCPSPDARWDQDDGPRSTAWHSRAVGGRVVSTSTATAKMKVRGRYESFSRGLMVAL